MTILRRWLVAALTALSLGTGSAAQATIESAAHPMARRDRVDFVTPVLGPFAYTHFCLRYADDCREHGHAFRRPRAVELTPARRAELAAVNADVNRAIAPVLHADDTSFDTWRIAPAAGDCNDYAVTKRHALLARGWPSRAVLLSEVVTTWGEHHLVLLVRTDRGDMVLDNLTAQIRPWTHVGYRWVRVQLPSEPSLWSTIRDPRNAPSS